MITISCDCSSGIAFCEIAGDDSRFSAPTTDLVDTTEICPVYVAICPSNTKCSFNDDCSFLVAEIEPCECVGAGWFSEAKCGPQSMRKRWPREDIYETPTFHSFNSTTAASFVGDLHSREITQLVTDPMKAALAMIKAASVAQATTLNATKQHRAGGFADGPQQRGRWLQGLGGALAIALNIEVQTFAPGES